MSVKGGVSPIKLRASKGKSRRGGAEAGKATAKKGNYLGGRGGFKKSSGKQGTGVNRAGYNVHTRLKPRKTPAAPGGGGTTKDNTPNKPYSFDENGDIVINNNNYINTAGGTNKNENINTNINNVDKENEKIKDKQEFYYKYRQDPNTTTKEEETSTSYSSIWNSDTKKSKYKGMTEGERYMKHGHSQRITDDQLNNANFKHGSYHKNGKAFHTSFEGYVEYMEYRKGMSKSEKEETKTSSSNTKRYKTTTKDGQKYKETYDAKT